MWEYWPAYSGISQTFPVGGHALRGMPTVAARDDEDRQPGGGGRDLLGCLLMVSP